MLCRKSDTVHGFIKIALAALCVIEPFGTIKACADADMIFAEELTKSIIQQPKIALHIDRQAAKLITQL
jgi:hypothetical protein